MLLQGNVFSRQTLQQPSCGSARSIPGHLRCDTLPIAAMQLHKHMDHPNATHLFILRRQQRLPPRRLATTGRFFAQCMLFWRPNTFRKKTGDRHCRTPDMKFSLGIGPSGLCQSQPFAYPSDKFAVLQVQALRQVASKQGTLGTFYARSRQQQLRTSMELEECPPNLIAPAPHVAI